MSSSSKKSDITKVIIYFYDIDKEVDLIDLEDEEDKLRKIKVNTKTNPMEVYIRFEDLIGDQQVNFIENKPKTVPKTSNVMEYLEVMDYIDKCNQQHAMLMHQVAETKMHCRKLYNEQVELFELSSFLSLPNNHEAVNVDDMKEVDLIDLEDEQDKLRKRKVSTKTNPMEVNIRFGDLIGDQQVNFIENKPKTVPKTSNIKEYIQVMDYIDRRSQKHALLMYQVAETKMRCRKLYSQYV